MHVPLTQDCVQIAKQVNITRIQSYFSQYKRVVQLLSAHPALHVHVPGVEHVAVLSWQPVLQTAAGNNDNCHNKRECDHVTFATRWVAPASRSLVAQVTSPVRIADALIGQRTVALLAAGLTDHC